MGHADDQQSQADALQNPEAWICLSCQLELRKDDRFCSRCGKSREEAQLCNTNLPGAIFEVWDADCDTEMLGILTVPSRKSTSSTRENLEKEKQSVLLRKASFAGASAEEMMASMDESCPKKAIIDLILSKESSEQQACASSCFLEEPLLTAPVLPVKPELGGRVQKKDEEDISRADDGPKQKQIEENSGSSKLNVEADVKTDEKESSRVEKKAGTSPQEHSKVVVIKEEKETEHFEEKVGMTLQDGDANTTSSPRSLAIADPAVSELAKQIGIRDDEIDLLGWIAERGLDRDFLPPRWSIRRDGEKGMACYVMKDDQSLSWENPNLTALQSVVSFARRYMQRPEQETLDAIKESLWHEHKVSLQSWFGPVHDVEGTPYYVHISGHSSWHDPREEAQFAFDLECILLDSLGEIFSTRFPEDEHGSEMQDVETSSFRQILGRRSTRSEPGVTIRDEAPLAARALPAHEDAATQDRLANVAPPGKEEKIRNSTSSRLSHALANIQAVTERDTAGGGHSTDVARTKVEALEAALADAAAREKELQETNRRLQLELQAKSVSSEASKSQAIESAKESLGKALEAGLVKAAARERKMKERNEDIKHDGMPPSQVQELEPEIAQTATHDKMLQEVQNIVHTVETTSQEHKQVVEITSRDLEPEAKLQSQPLRLKHTAAVRIQAVQRGRAVRQHMKVDAVFAVGARVEYYSDTYSKWLPAVVEERGDGFYKLNIKPRAEVSRMRKAPGEASEVLATPSDTTQPSWMNDPQVKARRRSVGQEADVGTNGVAGGLRTLDPQTLKEAIQNDTECEVYPVGTQVEYQSQSFGRWIPGVVEDYINGCYRLTCKPRAERNRVRRYQESAICPAAIERDITSTDGTIERNITTLCALPDSNAIAKVERPRPSVLELDSSLQSSAVAGSGSAACLALRKSSSQPTLAKKKDRSSKKALTVVELEQKVRRRNDRFKAENESMRVQIAQLREQIMVDCQTFVSPHR